MGREVVFANIRKRMIAMIVGGVIQIGRAHV